MISGATGAIAVVFASLVIKHGVEYLFATVSAYGYDTGALRAYSNLVNLSGSYRIR